MVEAGTRRPSVVLRNPGGAYSDAQKQYIYGPFTKETGIEVVIVASTLTKMLAMAKSGNAELDVADAGFDGLVTLNRTGALAPIDYASWNYADSKDVPEEYVTPTTAGLCLYATVLGYNKGTFPDGKQPKSWAGFWDAAKFPGARMLADMASSSPNLEFALIADGVRWTRSSRSISTGLSNRCRGSSHTSRNSGIPARCRRKMLADRDVVLGSSRPRAHLARPPHHRLPDEAVHEFTPSRDADSCRGQSRVQRRYFCARRRGTGKGCK